MRILTVALLVVLGLARATAVVPEGQGPVYERISGRNVFGLKPIPKEAPAQPPQPALPKIILTGITSIVEPKRVLLKVQMPLQPPQPPLELLLILSEGERDGAIEVRQIDETKRSVTLINSGTEMTLSLAKDGPTAANPGGPVTVPAQAQAPASGPPPPGLDLAGRHYVNRNPGRNGNGPSGAPPTAMEAPPSPVVPPVTTATEPITPEQEAILTELAREASKNK